MFDIHKPLLQIPLFKLEPPEKHVILTISRIWHMFEDRKNTIVHVFLLFMKC